MWWTPATLETASSILLVTCASSSAGAAPNWAMMTEMTGTSMFGMRVIGSLMKLTTAERHDGRSHTRGGSGCRIDQAEMLNAINVPPRSADRVVATS